MRHKTAALILIGLSVVLACVAVALGVRTLSGGGPEAADAAAVTPAGESEDYVTAQPTPDQTPTPEPTGTPTPEPTETPAPTETPWAGPLVKEQSAPVPAAYFADAGFLGNSVLSGLWLYNNDLLLPSDPSHWFWQDSLTIMGASPYAAQMAAYDFGKIYIEFGINELTYDQSTLQEAFNTVIDQLQADHPNAIIYLMSVTPVSQYCDANLSMKQSAVMAFNNMLQTIAAEQHVWYLDVYPVLCGPDGFLPSDVTPDGVHFNPAHYQLWLDYLTTHYVPDGREYAVPQTEAPAEDAGDTVTAAPAA